MKTKNSQFTKDFWTKFVAVILLISAFMLIGSTTASAAEINKPEISAEDMAAHLEVVEAVSTGAEDGLVLISEITTLEGDGTIATTRIYEKDVAAPYSSE